jgi:hypothetical protein
MSGHFLYHSIGTFPGKEDALRDELARFAAFWSREEMHSGRRHWRCARTSSAAGVR